MKSIKVLTGLILNFGLALGVSAGPDVMPNLVDLRNEEIVKRTGLTADQVRLANKREEGLRWCTEPIADNMALEFLRIEDKRKYLLLSLNPLIWAGVGSQLRAESVTRATDIYMAVVQKLLQNGLISLGSATEWMTEKMKALTSEESDVAVCARLHDLHGKTSKFIKDRVEGSDGLFEAKEKEKLIKFFHEISQPVAIRDPFIPGENIQLPQLPSGVR